MQDLVKKSYPGASEKVLQWLAEWFPVRFTSEFLDKNWMSKNGTLKRWANVTLKEMIWNLWHFSFSLQTWPYYRVTQVNMAEKWHHYVHPFSVFNKRSYEQNCVFWSSVKELLSVIKQLVLYRPTYCTQSFYICWPQCDQSHRTVISHIIVTKL